MNMYPFSQMDGGVVHPHTGVVHGGVPGVVHGMPVHGAGPDGEHPQHGPRRRYQNRPKPPNTLERLPLDEAAKRVSLNTSGMTVRYFFNNYL